MPARPRSWTDEQLVKAVRSSITISVVLEKLGPGKRKRRTIDELLVA